jgi:hypothetical protein
VLVHTANLQARSDFETIKEKLAERAPDIEVFIVNNRLPNSVTRRQAAARASLIFSPVWLMSFRPVRGKVYAGQRHTKMEEYEKLVAAGIPVPQAVMIGPETRLDPATWGPFTVIKPNVGMQGKGVRLVRTREVRWVDPRSLPRDDPRYGVPLLAQRFVDSGAHTTHNRVLTVLGRPVYSTHQKQDDPRPFDLDPNSDVPLDESIATNSGKRTITPNYNEEVIAFGATAWRAFPGVPVLGIDVIREEATGKLYVLEVNSGGLTWHISSNYGMALQRKYGLDYMNQFGALDIIADALIDVTRREAE